MNKIAAVWALFRQGEAVADPAKWKMRQVTGTMLAGVILAMVNLAKAFGYDIPIDTDMANLLGAGLLAGVNVVLTVTTTDKIGLPAAVGNRQGAAEGGDAAGRGLPAAGGADVDRGNDYRN